VPVRVPARGTLEARDADPELRARPPGLAWSSGPRFAFNFGFTDLGAGQCLGAWVPANLIFDQFELVLELRAADTLAGASDTTVLPVSGTPVAIEAWKPAGGGADLAAAIANVRTHLADNEHSTGPYMHGGRFVAFMHVGGMEYHGATTTAPGSLRHETFHSWWARGLKPASQADGWFDEAWTVYFDNGASASQPFNFADPPITLSPRNPWVRATPGNAYADGYRFWKGVASLVGVATLKDLMAEFYRTRRTRPVTTAQIEEFLVARAGHPLLVDAFHRYVYGLADPSPAPDVWLRDEGANGSSLQALAPLNPPALGGLREVGSRSHACFWLLTLGVALGYTLPVAGPKGGSSDADSRCGSGTRGRRRHRPVAGREDRLLRGVVHR
jgi:hypothetical protein